jgi:hypothetical protein
MLLGPVFVFAALLAQDQASLGAGAGMVRHEGGSSFSALTLSPGAQHLSPFLYVGATGAVSLLERGAWAGQARAEIWAAFPRQRTDGLRIALNATASATTHTGGVATGAGTALAEVIWVRDRGGLALGAGWAGGGVEGVPGVGSARWRARTWWETTNGTQLSLSAEGTRFLGAWYTDLGGGATVERTRLIASVWTSVRVSGAYGSTAAASALVQYFLTPSLALEGSGGNFLRDPFQGLPRAGFGGIGLRWYFNRRAQPVTAAPARQPLVAQRRGADTVVARFRMPGAQSVAIAGSWNAWVPDSLRSLGDDIWEAALRLPSGTYYFNLVVDGREWVVPQGVAIIADGMGGLLAVLTVP